MRKVSLSGAAALAILCPPAATAQIWVGQIVGNLMQPVPAGDWCYDGSHLPTPKQVQLVVPYVDKAIAEYERLATTPAALTPLFAKDGHWTLDGVESDVRVARDPWVRGGTRLVPDAYVRSTYGGTVLVRWKAIAPGGRVLGIYDALMFAKARSFALRELHLSSPMNAAQPEPLKPYCQVPGDVEKWQEGKAKRDAAKAAKAAGQK